MQPGTCSYVKPNIWVSLFHAAPHRVELPHLPCWCRAFCAALCSSWLQASCLVRMQLVQLMVTGIRLALHNTWSYASCEVVQILASEISCSSRASCRQGFRAAPCSSWRLLFRASLCNSRLQAFRAVTCSSWSLVRLLHVLFQHPLR